MGEEDLPVSRILLRKGSKESKERRKKELAYFANQGNFFFPVSTAVPVGLSICTLR